MNVAAPVLVLFLLGVGSLAELQKECTPGETKQLDCNSCFCSQAGVWGCTQKGCQTFQLEVTPGDQAARVRRSEGHCVPNTSFLYKDSNTCICSSDGRTALCTSRATTEVTPGDQAARVRRSEGHCVPNTSFLNKDSNTCICSSDGRTALCTSRATTAASMSTLVVAMSCFMVVLWNLQILQ